MTQTELFLFDKHWKLTILSISFYTLTGKIRKCSRLIGTADALSVQLQIKAPQREVAMWTTLIDK